METMEVAVLPMSPSTMASAVSRLPSSAYLSAPASPRRFDQLQLYPSNCCFYASAPASPSRAAAAVFRGQDLSDWDDVSSVVHGGDIDPEPFDFDNGFSGQLDKEGRRLAVPDLATADELFERGVIRPLNLQAERQHSDARGRASAAAVSDAVSSRSRRGSRSLSPMRGGATVADKEYFVKAAAMQSTAAPAANSSSLVKGGGGSKKWRLMDMLLFRSASEGRATGRGSKDPLCRFSVSSSSSSSSSSPSSLLPSLFRKRKPAVHEDVSNAGSRSGGSTRRSGRSTPSYPSVHAMHLAASRAASEEMKKKAPLPYHQNTLFGYMRHNPAIQSISRQFSNS